MSTRVASIAVTTSRPPAISTSTSGGSVTLVCPRTGSIQSSCHLHAGDLQHAPTIGNQKHHQLLGVHTISLLPLPLTPGESHAKKLGLAHATGTAEPSQGFCTLLSLGRTVNSHWRCRVPEPLGVLVTVTPSIVLGGASSSGTIYVWDVVLQDGRLLRTLPHVHYQGVTCIIPLQQPQRHVATAGADGRVHLFALANLVGAKTTTTTVTPLRMWTPHHSMPVTGLATVPGGRIVSSGEDGHVAVMDVAAGTVIACIPLGASIRTIVADDQRIYAGCVSGSIHSIQLNQYAVEENRLGASSRESQQDSLIDQIQGRPTKDASFRLLGHDRPITAMAMLENGALASGDSGGCLRIWEACVCVRIIHPWNSSTKGSTNLHPVTSIVPLWEYEAGLDNNKRVDGSAVRKGAADNEMTNLVSPLQTFEKAPLERQLCVPFLRPQPDVHDSVTEEYGNFIAVNKRRPA